MAKNVLARPSLSRSEWGSEERFAHAVVGWIQDQGWEVYQEVEPRRRDLIADIVAIRKPLVWVVETKLSFSLSVLWQAWKWKGFAHMVSVAVPMGSWRHRNRRMMEHLCRLMEIGLLLGRRVGYEKDEGAEIVEAVQARIDRKALVHYVTESLCEKQKVYAPAGNAEGKRWTPFQETCDRVRDAVRKKPGITMKELIDGIETHYASKASARSALAKWIGKGVVKGVVSKRDGKYLRIYLDG